MTKPKFSIRDAATVTDAQPVKRDELAKSIRKARRAGAEVYRGEGGDYPHYIVRNGFGRWFIYKDAA